MNFRGRGRGRGRGGFQRREEKVWLDRGSIVDRRFAGNDVSTSSASFASTEGVCSSNVPASSVVELQHQIPSGYAQQQRNSFNSFRPQLQQRNQRFKQQTPQEFPQDKPFFCDKCFYGYDFQRQYDNHLKTHIKCPEENCKFEANPWFVAKHITNVHSLSIMPRLSSHAADERWINERKRKFPTRDAVETKEDVEKAKAARGEILVGQNNFGRFKIQESDEFKKEVKANSTGDDRNNANVRNKKEDKSMNRRQQKEQTVDKTLLEMLLQEDIVHERNVLLQCIRYIVSNKFFEKTP